MVERFIAKIIPQGDNKFTWFVNLSGQTQESIDMIVEGRKSNPTVYIDETDEDFFELITVKLSQFYLLPV